MIVPVCEECLAKIRTARINPPLPVQGDSTAKEYREIFHLHCRFTDIPLNEEFIKEQFYKGLSAKSKEQLPAVKDLPSIADIVNLLTAIESFEREIFGCQKDTT